MMTNAKHFALFKRAALQCIKKWGINDWDIEIEHDLIVEQHLAQCRTNAEGHRAWIVLGKDWGESTVTPAELINAAREEVTHLLLAPVADLIGTPWVTESQNLEANERVVKRLKVLLP